MTRTPASQPNPERMQAVDIDSFALTATSSQRLKAWPIGPPSGSKE
jgi:hypothetical protein